MTQANRLKLPSSSARQQAENKIVWNEARCPHTALFFTIGYTGRPLNEILDLLESKDIRTLIDIRQYPVSMYRPEMSKNNLKQAIEERDMVYIHVPQLGVPRDIRAKAIETGTRDIIWQWYDQYVVAHYIKKNLHRFFNALEHPIALMCVETDPQECHRHRLSLAFEAMGVTSFDL
ncbi:MAG TPA: DUF488 domain-containing protein [Pyrinomonadaceae bacterium]|jgi:uncharacterized protein (DUF488 family)